MTTPFMELYAEGTAAALRDAFVTALESAGARRQPKPPGRSRAEFSLGLTARKSLAALLIEGESVFEMKTIVDAVEAYAKTTGGLVGSLSSAGDRWASVNTHWSEYRAGQTLFSASNQSLGFDLPETWQERFPEDDEVRADAILEQLAYVYGLREEVFERIHFAPTETAWTGEGLSAEVERAITSAGDVDIPGFAIFKHGRGAIGFRPAPAFTQAVTGEAAAQTPELERLVARVRTLKPFERIAFGSRLTVGAINLQPYQGRDPRTGDLVPMAARTLPQFEMCASSAV